MRHSPILLAAAVAGAVAWHGAAHADAPQTAAAEALFDDGRKLMEARRYTEACARFEESQRLDPGIGTQYNLADCWEKTGRIASAWGAFLDVSYAARQGGQPEREKVARERAQALAARLPRLTVVVAQAVGGLSVIRDGQVMGKGQWSTSVPVDPGAHRVAASAPGRRSWETTVQIAEAAQVTVQVPALQPAPKEPAPAVASSEPASGGAHRASAWVLGGLSLTGIALGSGYGLAARSKNNDSMGYCAEKTNCTERGVELRSDAQRDATISTIAFGVGAAALVGAVVLWVTAPRERAPGTASLRVSGSPIGGARIGLEGSW